MYICSLGAELFYYGVALSSDCNPAFDFTAVKAVCTHMTVAEIHVYIQVISYWGKNPLISKNYLDFDISKM